MKLLHDNGLLDTEKRAIWSQREDFVEVAVEDQEEAFQQTLAYMKDGRQTIVGGVLIDKHWVGHPDMLERVEGKSVFGPYYYVACDVKQTSVARDVHNMQVCFYSELLQRLQGVKPVQGYIVTHKKESISYDIESFEDRYRLTLEEIEKILAGQKPDHFLSSGCKQSPWFYECFEHSKKCNDLSLLNRVWRAEVTMLRQAGITTINELSKIPEKDLVNKVPDMDETRLSVVHDQAEALVENKIIVRHPIVLPAEKQVLYFDVESDPLRDWHYLLGVLSVDGDTETYHAFFAEKPEDENQMWQDFVEFISWNPGAIIYHYGEFERQVISGFIAKYGVSDDVLKTLEQGMVDLLDHLRPAVLFPMPFYSLKDLATHMGFHWRDIDASGANSIMWFEEWLTSQDPDLKTRILEYNEDDVRATRVVREWIRANVERIV